jgi:hypothetical protein
MLLAVLKLLKEPFNLVLGIKFINSKEESVV